MGGSSIGSTLGSLIGSAAGPIGSALGGAVGSLFGGGKKRGPSEDDLRAFRMHDIYDTFRHTLGAAKEFGIHPLTALGVQTTGSGYSTASAGGTDYKSMMSDAGADIGRAIAAGGTNLDKLQERLLLAQIQGQEIDNVSRASMLATKTNAVGSPPAMPPGAKAMLNSISTPLGSADGLLPLHTMAYDENGTPIRFFNTNDIGDNYIAQWGHFFRYTMPDYIQGTGKRLAKKFMSVPFYDW